MDVAAKAEAPASIVRRLMGVDEMLTTLSGIFSFLPIGAWMRAENSYDDHFSLSLVQCKDNPLGGRPAIHSQARFGRIVCFRCSSHFKRHMVIMS